MGHKIDQKTHKSLPDLIFPPQTKSEEALNTRLIKEKKIRKIGPRLYSPLPQTKLEPIVRAQWAQIISRLFPDALLSHQSALEFKPSSQNEIILTGTTNRTVHYPGLVLRFVRGPAPLSSDGSFLGFRASSQARAFLENLSTSRTSQWRSLSAETIEAKLEQILRIKGETALLELRDQAKIVARKLKWTKAEKRLDHMIGALLGTQPSSKLVSRVGRARAKGKPFDQERVNRFDLLLSTLRATPLQEIKDDFKAKDHFNNKAFFEAYFSNYIEGTDFDIREAEEIIFEHHIPPNRPKDAHDILETFEIVSDLGEMKKTPRTAEELKEIIQNRHSKLMSARPEITPGRFKLRPNRAGETYFVQPEDVEGTLEQGFIRYLNLSKGLARAIFMMFLIAEIHPFTDGNGRIARIMMNAELIAAQLSTIIIPNVYREDYLGSLKALSRRDRAEPLIKMLQRAHVFSHLDFSTYLKRLGDLEERNWFRDPKDAKIV